MRPADGPSADGNAHERRVTGLIKPAAVIMATVALPSAKRMMEAISQAMMTGCMLSVTSTSLSTLPMPESMMTLLKLPAAPMTSKMETMGRRDLSQKPLSSMELKPRFTPRKIREATAEMNRAITGWPKNSTRGM